MKTDKVILGVLGGAAAGALLGILFAPDKGKKTRKKIMQKGMDYSDDMKDKFDHVLTAATKKYEAILQEGKDLIAEGKEKFTATKDGVENFEV
ncbi:YtxH domain-containing protein [Flavobacterium restrictum]|uniref:YtxH domain-containing protein n=1 Tax=Flavobacterium restrictum TaxID=2594428 RepID=A0A553DXM7_9FLAO|nr:YtxH domain-containing protein [Flavobacterium restrictum]TRX37544.1 YtxH domain-containing protein [Flavobacterium restrictum]